MLEIRKSAYHGNTLTEQKNDVALHFMQLIKSEFKFLITITGSIFNKNYFTIKNMHYKYALCILYVFYYESWTQKSNKNRIYGAAIDKIYACYSLIFFLFFFK